MSGEVNKPVAQKHNVRANVLSMLEEELPAVEERIAWHHAQVERLTEWHAYLVAVGRLSGYEPPRQANLNEGVEP